VALDENERELCRVLGYFTNKPMAIVVNIGEESLSSPPDLKGVVDESIPVVTLSAKIEHELSLLDDASREEFMRDLGLTEPARSRFVRGCYEALGLISFLTVGEDEVRAWPIRKGSTALEAAGKIHTDIKRGFIRAETFHYDDLLQHGDEKTVRSAGKFRLEGKTYVVTDGDIMSFRFNV
jgi:ribosome-binding ATPase